MTRATHYPAQPLVLCQAHSEPRCPVCDPGPETPRARPRGVWLEAERAEIRRRVDRLPPAERKSLDRMVEAAGLDVEALAPGPWSLLVWLAMVGWVAPGGHDITTSVTDLADAVAEAATRPLRAEVAAARAEVDRLLEEAGEVEAAREQGYEAGYHDCRHAQLHNWKVDP